MIECVYALYLAFCCLSLHLSSHGVRWQLWVMAAIVEVPIWLHEVLFHKNGVFECVYVLSYSLGLQSETLTKVLGSHGFK